VQESKNARDTFGAEQANKLDSTFLLFIKMKTSTIYVVLINNILISLTH